MPSWFKLFTIFLIISGTALTPVLFLGEARATTVSMSVSVLGNCGDGTKDWNEDCDDLDFGGATCLSLGYDPGALNCNANCTFDTSSCPPATAPAPSGGGGGYRLPSSQVTLLGRAYPDAVLTVLKDGLIFIDGKRADNSGSFEIRNFDISPEGIYTFGFRAKDAQGRESATFNVTVTVNAGVNITISGILVPPTVGLEKTGLKRGETLKVSGQSAPQSEVSLSIVDSFGKEAAAKKSQAGTDGNWLFSFDTSVLEEGSYAIKAKAQTLDGLVSSFSQAFGFSLKGVALPGLPEVPEIPEEEAPEKIGAALDVNGDGRVNLTDFSILLYWWGKENFSTDFNGDKITDLADFSIMMYWWTG